MSAAQKGTDLSRNRVCSRKGDHNGDEEQHITEIAVNRDPKLRSAYIRGYERKQDP